ncbi:MAG TPA: DinB family protein [Thermomicrobiales bacterium]|nr:DinB family protein [Thermomicrobiales bacterium]
MDLLERLLGHDRWATNVLFDTCAPLTDEQIDQQFDIGLESIHGSFGHIIGNIEFWTDSMQETEVDRSDESWARADLCSRFDRAYDEFERFAIAIRDEDRIDDTFTDAWGYPQTFGAILLHLPLHNEGHRTEILHMLVRLEVESVPEIDHALWDFHRRGLSD